jgi:hypothetical protein
VEVCLPLQEVVAEVCLRLQEVVAGICLRLQEAAMVWAIHQVRVTANPLMEEPNAQTKDLNLPIPRPAPITAKTDRRIVL